MRTSFNHQPEAQHPKHPAIRWAADYPIFGSWLCKNALPEVSRRRDLDEWRYGSFFSG